MQRLIVPVFEAGGLAIYPMDRGTVPGTPGGVRSRFRAGVLAGWVSGRLGGFA